MKAKSLLLGFLVGGTTACIGTLLSAPASGKETRNYLKENKECLKKQLIEVKKQLIDLKNSVVVASKEGKETIASFSSDVKTCINNWKRDILPHQQELQKEIQAIETAIQELETNLSKNKPTT